MPSTNLLNRGLIPARAGNTPRFAPNRQATRAHPRSRGEHRSLEGAIGTSWGSSPLARGTRLVVAVLLAAVGLIPARAGNTRPDKWLRFNSRAHPRSRGEHASPAGRKKPKPGSSPLARGTLCACLGGAAAHGLIPARAGNTQNVQADDETARAHPRSRGEHRPALAPQSTRLGSSPLARGTRYPSTGA